MKERVRGVDVGVYACYILSPFLVRGVGVVGVGMSDNEAGL